MRFVTFLGSVCCLVAAGDKAHCVPLEFFSEGFYFCVDSAPFPEHWILLLLSHVSSVSSEAVSCPFNAANGVLFQHVLK